ncbi:MAG TPA: vanadium-dependent haloperoxidase [Pseudomonadota bacterium]|nr:vanadium-dependent haloperoxidase [Rhodanobacteraceae bacterium]MBP9155288.1 vanadium-dependent haloperoxidase [Xanthomonadales bacterium]HQW81048.1 vanadium-dependent haloperoxidase [Pseudomonadota bacterium]
MTMPTRVISVATLIRVAMLVAAGTSSALGAVPTVLPAARNTPGAKGVPDCSLQRSVARAWNEQLLAAIRIDAPRPTVHARNLFHVSMAMYDAWTAFDPVAQPVLVDESASAALLSTSDARERAISYAAYRVLVHRFSGSLSAGTTLPRLSTCMSALGFDPGVDTVIGGSAEAIGNRIAAAIIAYGVNDGANEQQSYIDPIPFFPTNSPMLVQLPGTGGLADINAWQPLIPPGAPGVQSFLTSQWRDVLPFAAHRPSPGEPYADPGAPPLLGLDGSEQLRADMVTLIRYSSELDPSDATVLNTSPAVRGNNPLGSNDGHGYASNPVDGSPYADNWVRRGDWTRGLAEFWADGPLSTTPPGHWNEIANAVTDHPASLQRVHGLGAPVDDLEWDIKLYLALNGALHDTAIATWEIKRIYNASRPITLIREMATLGQSSNSALPHYHPNGLPLEDGLIELITVASSAPGERHAHLAAHIGEIAIRAWAGHPANPATQAGGSAWILGDRWIPYQQRNFVTPPFPGYTSGHSGFSRAAAEVLTEMTGNAYFPGGIAEARIAADGSGFSLGFEYGPSAPLMLQWATYFDAADEAGVSRIYGGIHPSYDDLPGRIVGHHIGSAAWLHAVELFGTPASAAVPVPGPSRLLWLMTLAAMLAIALRQFAAAAPKQRDQL